ncbi:MAG: type I phosphomannose isomerase catalytic subunit [Clostridia bacterium]|jgi:mannose-6-phosphate isomerase
MFYPLKFKSLYKDYIWGGRNLEKLGKILPEGIVAESWEISCNEDGISIVENGEFKDIALPVLIKRFGKDLIGTSLDNSALKTFPLLIKLIDANDKLSVQVHPDDSYAKIHENGGLGKNEMWYIISARPGARLVYNVLPGVTKEIFAKAIEDDTVEQFLNYVPVRQGDVLNIPAGLIHAIGEGIVLAEIQQNSNTTYRVYDYNRVGNDGQKRPLHIEKSLDVINFSSAENQAKAKGLEVRLSLNSNVTYYIANQYFCAQLYNIYGYKNEDANGSKFEIYIFIEGNCRLKYESGEIDFKAGESALIPASMGKYTLEGKFRALKTFVPNIENDVIKPLMKAGFSEDRIYENVCGLLK